MGRDDVGVLAPGYQADFAAFPVDDLVHAGTTMDPVAALVFCQPVNASYTVVGGDILVRAGQLVSCDLENLLAQHQQISVALANDELA